LRVPSIVQPYRRSWREPTVWKKTRGAAPVGSDGVADETGVGVGEVLVGAPEGPGVVVGAGLRPELGVTVAACVVDAVGEIEDVAVAEGVGMTATSVDVGAPLRGSDSTTRAAIRLRATTPAINARPDLSCAKQGTPIADRDGAPAPSSAQRLTSYVRAL
jgi:hypothetical protein